MSDSRLAKLLRDTVQRYGDDIVAMDRGEEPSCMDSHTDTASDFLMLLSEAHSIIEESDDADNQHAD